MTTTTKKKGLPESVHLFLDGARGQYLPRDFARTVNRAALSGVKPEDLDYLARGPGGCLDEKDLPLAEGETERGEFYWETWQTVCDNAKLTDPDSGVVFSLHQDDSLFLIPDSWEFDEASDKWRPSESDTLQRFELPAYWASYLINGDDSGISEADKAAADQFLAKEELAGWSCTEVGEQYFSRSNDAGTLAGDVAEYTFIRFKPDDVPASAPKPQIESQ